MLLNISQYSEEWRCVGVSFNNNVVGNTVERVHHSHKKWKDVSFRFLWLWYTTGVFSSNYCEISKNSYFEEHLRMAAFESKIEFVQSIKTVQSAANIYWKLFFKVLIYSTAWERTAISNKAQTRLLLCKFPLGLQFYVTTFEINHHHFLSFLSK